MYQTMEQGKDAPEALAVPKARDPDVEYRQLLILLRRGDPIAFTGRKYRPWAGHMIGEDLITADNVLADEHVIAAMAGAFRPL